MNIKKTLDNAGMSQYRFAQLMDRSKEHVWKWYNAKSTPSKLMKEKIEQVCQENNITIIEK